MDQESQKEARVRVLLSLRTNEVGLVGFKYDGLPKRSWASAAVHLTL